jgi:hypothetical protein
MMQLETLFANDTIPNIVPRNGTRPVTSDIDDNCQAELDGILFKNDCMYRHNLVRINYTTYEHFTLPHGSWRTPGGQHLDYIDIGCGAIARYRGLGLTRT